MTVRITKPKFNLREKLSELDKPTGVKGSELMRSDTAQEVRGLIGADRKNLAINGDMRIAQRGTGAFTVNSSYGADRWRTMFGAGGFNTQNVTDAPVGFNNSIKVTQTSYGSASYKMIEHYIEGYNIRGLGYGTAEAKTATLSFFVKGSVAGLYAVTMQNAATGGSRVCYVSSYTINRPNVWEYKTVKIFPPTSHTWYTDHQRGIGIIFSLGSTGYTVSTSNLNKWLVQNSFDIVGAIDLSNISGATLQITGVQYEIGENATDFEHRSYGEEYALCQRYHYTMIPLDNYAAYGMGGAYSSTQAVAICQFPVPMRAKPTFSYTGALGDFYDVVGGFSGSGAFSSMVVNNTMGTVGGQAVSAKVQAVGSGTAGNPFMLASEGNTSTRLHFDAEL